MHLGYVLEAVMMVLGIPALYWMLTRRRRA